MSVFRFQRRILKCIGQPISWIRTKCYQGIMSHAENPLRYHQCSRFCKFLCVWISAVCISVLSGPLCSRTSFTYDKEITMPHLYWWRKNALCLGTKYDCGRYYRVKTLLTTSPPNLFSRHVPHPSPWPSRHVLPPSSTQNPAPHCVKHYDLDIIIVPICSRALSVTDRFYS